MVISYLDSFPNIENLLKALRNVKIISALRYGGLQDNKLRLALAKEVCDSELGVGELSQLPIRINDSQNYIQLLQYLKDIHK